MRLITAIMCFCVGIAGAQILLLQGCKEQRNTVTTPQHQYMITQDNARYYGSKVFLSNTYAKLYSGNKVTTFYGTFCVEER